ncbi:MAG: adenosylmethionine--8-amino-7-oxononanoate transaminase [Candidatus Omnitrophota bacterium]
MALLIKDRPSLTKELVDKDKAFVWHPFTQMRDWQSDIPGAPLVIDRAAGSYLYDSDGKKYLDGVSSLWVTVHGHGRPEITKAIACQAAKLDHSTMLGLANTPAVELAERLVGIAPTGLEKVFYSDNGSTSVEIAVKMAYQYWQNTGVPKKSMICHLENSYHGDTLGSVSVGGIDLFHKVYRKLVFKAHQVPFPDCYRDTRAFEAVEAFEGFLKKEHSKVAALVLEPIVQGAAGMFMWPAGVLKCFEVLCRKYDVLLICDEVATGFGRTGRMFACEHEDVHPDLLCVAKGLSAGVLPLAATLTTGRIFDGFKFPYKDMKAFFHGHTYTGNPIACAAALANLELFRKDRTLDHVRITAGLLARGLERFRDMVEVGDIRQRGLMVGIELVKDRATKAPFDWKERVGVRVCQKARDYGVIIRPLGNVIVLMPPLSISSGEIDILLGAVERSIKDILADRNKPYCGC